MNSATVKMTLLILAILLALILVLQNTQSVTFTFLFWQFSISQILLTVLCLLLGFLLGILAAWRQTHRQSKNAAAAAKPEKPVEQ